MRDPTVITELLQDVTGGDRGAVDQLFVVVYDELRRLAQSYLGRERADHTLQATALVHEAYMRLVDGTRATPSDRSHFFAIGARAIRQILIDHARRRGRVKRGGGWRRSPLEDAMDLAVSAEGADLLDLDAALARLAASHPEKEQVIVMRFFGGMTAEEVAQATGVTTRTVERYWRFGRAWLYRELNEPS